MIALVRIALRRPYTFVVLALFILIIGPLAALRTPVDIFPDIRIPVPQLTEERRKEIVKKAHDIAEHARNAVRLARRDGNDKLKKMEKDKQIGQDDERRGLDEVQKLHDRYIHEVNEALQNKEKQILEH